MNGRVAKLLRKVWTEPEQNSERRAFRKAYTRSSSAQQAQVRKTAQKIADARGKGQEVKHFRVDPVTHQTVPIEKGGTDERPSNSQDNPSSTRGRKGNHQEKS